MDNDGVSPEGVIADLADQNRKLSVDCAVLRTAIKQLQAEITELQNPPPPGVSPQIEGQQILDGDDTD